MIRWIRRITTTRSLYLLLQIVFFSNFGGSSFHRLILVMDKVRGEVNGCENKAIVSVVESSQIEDQISEEEESESQCLLPPRKGGMSRSTDKIKRSVQWNDNKGDNLAEVLVYEPSEVSDTEDDDSDSCICTIM